MRFWVFLSYYSRSDMHDIGYFLGKNMIMTFETSQHAISSNIIKAMIKEYLV